MFKKLFFVIVALLLGVAANAQEWVSFGSRAEGAPPEVSVSRSDNQQVSFTVGLSGMYVESKNETGGLYKRLSMPQCQKMGAVGSPELPVVTQMVAIPECSDVNVVVTMSGVQTFSNYLVYPVPMQEVRNNEDGTVYVAEVFTQDVAVYGQNALMPVEAYSVLETGALRSQRYMRIELHPVQYNPVTQTLSVATEMEVTLTFVNATTPVNANLGIFNNVATNTMVNYTDQGIKASINDKAFEKGGFQQGEVKWKRLSTASEVNNLTADYLIICANAFFSGGKPHDEIMRLANHRAQYNGFDVWVLNAEDIISDGVGFTYEDNTIPPIFKKEQRIRTCIRTIYETGTAHHTMDGKLAYVLLVGDVDGGQTGNNGMPSSYDHDLWINQVYASDYYFSCITKTNGQYDEVGDLYIGRFCVPNNLNTDGNYPGLTHLHNMVTKTIDYETELKPNGTFKKRTTLAMGGGSGFTNIMYEEWFLYVSKLLQIPYIDGVNTFALNPPDGNSFKEAVIAMLNGPTNGVLFNMFCHGSVENWGLMHWDILSTSLENSHEQPFCFSKSCETGKFDDNGYRYSIAEYMTSYSESKGFVGMLAPTTSPYIATEHHYNIPTAIFGDLSFITGEFILEAKALHNFYEALVYNLFGDPALNIMAEGYEIKTHTILKDNITNITVK